MDGTGRLPPDPTHATSAAANRTTRCSPVAATAAQRGGRSNPPCSAPRHQPPRRQNGSRRVSDVAVAAGIRFVMFAVTATATLPAAVGCGSSSTIVPRCTNPPSLLARRLLLHLPLAELVARHTEIAMKTTAAILASQPKPQGIVGQALAWTCGVMANHPVGGTFCSVVTGRTTTPTEASDRDTEKENSPAAPAERRQATMFGDGPERTIASQELQVRVAPMQPGDFGTSGSTGGGPVRMCRHLRSATAPGQERDGEPPSKRGMRRRPRLVGSWLFARTPCRRACS